MMGFLSDEYFPEPQTPKQQQVEARSAAMGDGLTERQDVRGRRFFRTASGMAAAFLAMNQVCGTIFAVAETEAATSGRFFAIRKDYLLNGANPSNLPYGYIRRT
jgi:hypothetical protein